MSKTTSKTEYYAILFTALSGFFLLAGYNFIRSSTPALFIKAFGKENLPLAMAVMTLCVFVAIALYNRSLTYIGARKTFHLCTFITAVVIVFCCVGINFKIPIFSAIIHIFKDIYIVLLIEQLWSFLNSSVTVGTGKKWNGPLVGVMTIGPFIAGQFTSTWAPTLGTVNIILFSAVLLIPMTVAIELGYRLCKEPQAFTSDKQKEQRKKKGHFAWEIFKQRPAILFLLLIVLTSQILAASTTIRFQGIVSDTIIGLDKQTAYFGWYYSMINLSSTVMQFILVPLLLSIVPLRIIHLSIPLIHLFIGVVALFIPGLETAALACLIFKAVDYSLFRSAKELVYVPFSFDVRYRSKGIIDVFGYRLGKGGTAGLIAIARKLGLIAESGYAFIAILAASLWMIFAIPLGKSPSGDKNLKEIKDIAETVPADIKI